MSVIRLTVTITHDDEPVHEFTRSTTNATAGGLKLMLSACLAWMQSYQGAVNEEQWAHDVSRAHAPKEQFR